MIHEEKTKKITNVKEIWKRGLNYHKIWRTFVLIFSKNYSWFEKLYLSNSRKCARFILFQTPRRWFKRLSCASFLQPTSRCLEPSMKYSPSFLTNYWKPTVKASFENTREFDHDLTSKDKQCLTNYIYICTPTFHCFNTLALILSELWRGLEFP